MNKLVRVKNKFKIQFSNSEDIKKLRPNFKRMGSQNELGIKENMNQCRYVNTILYKRFKYTRSTIRS